MSVSGLKAELKFLESIFDKDHERFRIVSWKLDELHCQFVLLPPPPGSGPQPPPPLTIHCNITVRGPGAAGEGRGHGPPSLLSAGRGRSPAAGVTQHWGRGGPRGPLPLAAPCSVPTATKVRERAPPGLSSPPGRGPGSPSGCVGGRLLGGRAAGAGQGRGPPPRRPLRGREPPAGTKGGRARGSGGESPRAGSPPRRSPPGAVEGRTMGVREREGSSPPPPVPAGARGMFFAAAPSGGQRFAECATPARPAGGRPAPNRAGKGLTGGPGRRRGLPPAGTAAAGAGTDGRMGKVLILAVVEE